MNTRTETQFIREGDLVAEVQVEVVEPEEGWASYISPEGAEKLDAAREALRPGDLDSARRLGHIFRIVPSS